MTVEELIKVLSRYPGGMTVLLVDEQGFFSPKPGVRELLLRKDGSWLDISTDDDGRAIIPDDAAKREALVMS